MSPEDLEAIHLFFENYTSAFISNARDGAPYALKREHTFRVRDNIGAMGRALGVDPSDIRLGEAVGLLHDVGRFPQFRDYGTFRDSVSVNHGVLGAEIIRDRGVLDEISTEEKSLILIVVETHNAYHLRSDMGQRALFLTRLLRDGDKLDILRVMIDKYHRDLRPQEERSKDAFITLDLNDDGTLSSDLLKRIWRGEMLDSGWVSSLNDLKLLQLSWVFDFNFPPAYGLLKERNLMGKIVATLPRTQEVLSLETFIMDVIESGAQGRIP